MRKLLALAALLLAPLSVHASTISAGACDPGGSATPCAPGQIVSGPSPLLSVPSTTTGAFTWSGSAITGVSATGATFNSQTIQVSTTGGTLDVYFTVSGVPTQQLPLLFTSTFTSNQQNATTHSVTESTWADNSDTAFGLSTNLASATLTNALLQTAGPIDTIATPAASESFTELYQITLQGCGTQPNGICTGNLTIDLSASEVPEPASLAMLGVGLLGLTLVRRRAH